MFFENAYFAKTYCDANFKDNNPSERNQCYTSKIFLQSLLGQQALNNN